MLDTKYSPYLYLGAATRQLINKIEAKSGRDFRNATLYNALDYWVKANKEAARWGVLGDKLVTDLVSRVPASIFAETTDDTSAFWIGFYYSRKRAKELLRE